MSKTHLATAGGKFTKEYSTWCGMRQRCNYPNHVAFKNYGGRGIRVCERWQGEHGFENFLADIGPAPTPQHTLDRFPNNDGNYEPGNVRWATRLEQRINQRPTVRHCSEETRQKLAQTSLGNKSNTGRTLPEEQRHKISESLRGGKRSEETRRKMAAARARWWANKHSQGENHAQTNPVPVVVSSSRGSVDESVSG